MKALSRNIKRFTKNTALFVKWIISDKVSKIFILGSVAITVFSWLLVYYNYYNIPEYIPIFYTLPWGEPQIGQKVFLLLPVIIGTIIIPINIFLSARNYASSHIQIARFYSYVSFFTILLLAIFTTRIVFLSALTPIAIPMWLKLVFIPTGLSFITTLISTPLIIKFAKNFGFIDDPLTHKHPAMLITKPIPRAGGFAFFIGIFVPALFILPILLSQKLIGILIGASICVFLGLRDDKHDMSPYTRLFLQILAVFIVAMSGIILIYIPNPFGEVIKLDSFKFVIELFGEKRNIHYISVFIASAWMLIMMNFMSWANGTDGVYAGLISVSAFVVAALMFKTLNGDPEMAKFIKLASLVFGAGIAMAIFTWPPNKIMWGFGATAPALIITALSIIGSTKVATTLLVLMIPFLDGMFAILRRIKRGQMPFWGDREHFHHRLLDGLGWSKTRIAVFYWITAIIFAAIGIGTSGKTRALSVATVAVLVLLAIATLNFIQKPSLRSKKTS